MAGKLGRGGVAYAMVLQPKWDLGLQRLVLEAPLPVWSSACLGLLCHLSLRAAAWHIPLFFLLHSSGVLSEPGPTVLSSPSPISPTLLSGCQAPGTNPE